jgi:hypothetical protein
MGFSLTPNKSIWDEIGDAVSGGVKTVGNAAALGYNNLIGNTQQADISRQALGNSEAQMENRQPQAPAPIQARPTQAPVAPVTAPAMFNQPAAQQAQQNFLNKVKIKAPEQPMVKPTGGGKSKNVVGGIYNATLKPVVNTVTGTVVEPAREVIAQATHNPQAQAAAHERANQDISGSLPVVIPRTAANLIKGFYYTPEGIMSILETQATGKEDPKLQAGREKAIAAFEGTPVGMAAKPALKGLAQVKPGIYKDVLEAHGIDTKGAWLNALGEGALGIAAIASGNPDFGATNILGDVSESVAPGITTGARALMGQGVPEDVVTMMINQSLKNPELAASIERAGKEIDAKLAEDTAAKAAKLEEKATPATPAVTTEPPKSNEPFYRNETADNAAISVRDNGGTFEQAKEAYKAAHPFGDKLDEGTLTTETLQAIGKGRDYNAPIHQVVVPENLPGKVGQYAQKLADTHATKLSESENIDEVLAKGNAHSIRTRRDAASLERAIRNEYTKEERTAANDLSEGGIAPEQTTQRVRDLSHLNDELAKQGYDISKISDPKIGRVENYSTRQITKSPGTGVKTSDFSPKVLMKKLSDAFNTTNKFSTARGVQKYVASDGTALYGKLDELGLKANKETGAFTDASGKEYQRAYATGKEISANSGYRFEEDISKNMRDYHQEIGALRAKQNVVRDLAENPEKYGLSDRPLGEGWRQISIHSDPNSPLNLMYATDKVADQIEGALNPGKRLSAPAQAWRNASNTLTQFIVLNPRVHTANLAWQALLASGNQPLFEGSRIPAGPIGAIRVGYNFVKLVTDGDIRDAAIDRYFEDGGYTESFGKDNATIVTKTLDKMGLPHLNKANATFMSGLETDLRVAIHESNLEMGMKASDSIKNINKFMGDSKAVNAAAQNAGLFMKWFRTQYTSLGQMAAHPIENAGANVNFIVGVAMIYGVQEALREWSRNPNASVQIPGNAGLIKQIVEVPGQLAQHRVPNLVTNHVNPILMDSINQITSTNQRTGQKLETADARKKTAISDLFAPSKDFNKVDSGKASPAEEALNLATGITLSHAKDAPASPNHPIFNTPGAKPELGSDPTGYQQQAAYYDTTRKASDSLDSNNKKRYEGFIAGENDATGAKIGSDDKQVRAKNADLSSQPDILKAVTDQKREYAAKTGTQLDPLYDPKYDDIRAQYLLQQSTPYKSDDYNRIEDQNKDRLSALNTDRTAYFATQDFSNAPKSMRVQLPQIDDQTSADMKTAQGLSGKEKIAFIASHPNVQDAYDKIFKYTNDKRNAQGYDSFKAFPKADPETQSLLNNFFALPKGDGPKGGNATEAKWIKEHPNEYAKIQNYLAGVSEYELANSAGADKYAGSSPSQQMLKSAYSLGKYDIIKDAGGTYSINPQAVTAVNNANFNKGGGVVNIEKAMKNFVKAQNPSKYAVKMKINTHRDKPLRQKLAITKPVVKNIALRSKSVKIKGKA